MANINIKSLFTGSGNKQQTYDFSLVKNQFEEGEYQEVIKQLSCIDNKSSAETYLLAEAYFYAEQPTFALQQLNQINTQVQNDFDSYLLILGQTYVKLADYTQALDCFNHYFQNTDIKTKDSQLLFNIGVTYYYNQMYDEATSIFQQFETQTKIKVWDHLNTNGFNHIAIYYLEAFLQTNKRTPALLNKLASFYMYEVMYDEAKQLLSESFEIDGNLISLERLAIIADKLRQYDLAIELLEQCNIENNKHKIRLGYKLARLYYLTGNPEQASHTFNQYRQTTGISNESILNNPNYIAGIKAMETELWPQAINYIQSAIYQYNGHNGVLYSLLGHAYHMNEQFTLAAESFLNQQIIWEPTGKGTELLNSREANRRTTYTEYYNNLKVDNFIAMYSSYNGDNFSGNMLAIFKELSKDPNIKHFIVLKDPNSLAAEIKNIPNVYPIARSSRLYYKILATAKYIFTNGTMALEYIRKDEQVYVNTWHGTPIKHLGLDITDSSYSATRNIKNTFMKTTHSIQPNQFTKDTLIQAFDITDFSNINIEVTGYPRQDLMINATTSRKQELKKMLGIGSNKPVVLYAPTYRDEINKGLVPNSEMKDKAIKKLEKNNKFEFIFKGHNADKSIVNVANDIDTNELLSIVDVLITDYSSIAIDFLATNKPIIYYTYDLDQYRQTRGFYFEISEITNSMVNNVKDLIKLVNKQVTNPTIDELQISAKAKFCPIDDGHATERLFEMIFNEQQPQSIDTSQTILLYAGDFIQKDDNWQLLTEYIEIYQQRNYTVNVLVTQQILNTNHGEKRLHILRDQGVHFIFHYMKNSVTLDEHYAIDKLLRDGRFTNVDHFNLCKAGYERNNKRIFASCNFDSIINLVPTENQDIDCLLSFNPSPDRKLHVSGQIVNYLQSNSCPTLVVSAGYDQIVCNRDDYELVSNLFNKYHQTNIEFKI